MKMLEICVKYTADIRRKNRGLKKSYQQHLEAESATCSMIYLFYACGGSPQKSCGEVHFLVKF